MRMTCLSHRHVLQCHAIFANLPGHKLHRIGTAVHPCMIAPFLSLVEASHFQTSSLVVASLEDGESMYTNTYNDAALYEI